MIDSATDVRIGGMLPMVVARNTDSGMDTSRVFGPGWNTTLDCRIEILPGQILMMTPDGALLEFPPAPVDGTEVGDVGRPWRLCFVDGAYRVRNISQGITYVFGVAGSEAQGGEPCYRPDGPVRITRSQGYAKELRVPPGRGNRGTNPQGTHHRR